MVLLASYSCGAMHAEIVARHYILPRAQAQLLISIANITYPIRAHIY